VAIDFFDGLALRVELKQLIISPFQ
jgi:hypothetical protein